MATIKNPPLIAEDVVNEAKELGSALLADGMIGMGIPNCGCMEAAMMPIDIDIRMAGTAMTVETSDGDNYPIHVATYAGGDGYIMVIDGNNYQNAAYIGELICSAAKAVGFWGIVCDGLARDRVECIELGLPIYSKGFMQRGPKKENPGKINEKVTCGGITVNPGDLVVGDCDGVTVVPRDQIAQVFENAKKKQDYEIKRKETIKAYMEARKNGTPLPQLAPQWVLDML